MVGSRAPSARMKNMTLLIRARRPSSRTSPSARGKLQRHHPDVDGHADRRLEQHRGGVEETRNVEVGQVPVTTDVDGDGEAAQRIAEQARQQGRRTSG